MYVNEGVLVVFMGSMAFAPPGSRAFTPESCIKAAINGHVPGGVNAALPTARRHLRNAPVEGPNVHRMPCPAPRSSTNNGLLPTESGFRRRVFPDVCAMKRRVWYHLAFWLAFWFIYAYTYSRYDGNLGKYALTEGLQMPARMLATYLCFWFFERFSGGGEQKTWLAFGGAAAANLLGGLLNRALKGAYIVPVYFPDATYSFWSYRMVYDIFDCVLASCTALSARMYFRQQALQRREAQLRVEKSEAELRALKGQIQPHFLFNTINNLYALARMKSPKTAPVALKLAHLLRYVLYESAKSGMPLEKEVQNLRDYVELEKIRFDDDRLSVKMDVKLDDPGCTITPLLLLPLVENAFKHGVSEQRDHAWVNISISLKNKVLEAKIENSAGAGQAANPQGIGLQNVRRQLELLYPHRHKFSISQTMDAFSSELRIDLNDEMTSMTK